MTNKAVVLTAYNRPALLEQVLESWSAVRSQGNWFFLASVEPSAQAEEIAVLFTKFCRSSNFDGFHLQVNPERHGVLHHPWVCFDKLFRNGFDFVVRAEDDLLVSDDTLAYFEWSEFVFRNNQAVASIHAYSDSLSTEPGLIEVSQHFNPLVWGTWADRWDSFMRDTWDHDYSTNNGTPGVQAGWDWNLNTRLYPTRNLYGVYPKMSRVHNIGIFGTHSTPDNFYTAPSFRSEYGYPPYELVG